jgi:hypothetical protein
MINRPSASKGPVESHFLAAMQRSIRGSVRGAIFGQHNRTRANKLPSIAICKPKKLYHSKASTAAALTQRPERTRQWSTNA